MKLTDQIILHFRINQLYILLLITPNAVVDCSENYSRYVGKDIRDVVKEIDDDTHMVVWPRDNSIIYRECREIDFVTIVPKYPPNHAIHIEVDEKCAVTKIEKRQRNGL